MTSLIYLNPAAEAWTWADPKAASTATGPAAPSVLAFHQTLPDYAPSPLRAFPTLARDLGLGHVLLKDESRRFGLPSFKILGASWAVHRAVAAHVGAAPETPGPELGTRAREAGVRIVTPTAGNWGRAVARMAKNLGVPATVFVSALMPKATKDAIASEGAEVVPVPGNYDDSLVAATKEARKGTSLLILDVGMDGYEEIPKWVVEGYGTMLDESEDQVLEHTGGKPATHAIVPVGAGSIAQAVAQHFKAASRPAGTAKVISVESTMAPSLKASLEAGGIVTIPTDDTIMYGLNCGTVSTIAWPVLRNGVDACVLVTDTESDTAVQELKGLGMEAGPCGAATLAALRRAIQEKREELGLNESSVVLLHCTEGPREYEVSR